MKILAVFVVLCVLATAMAGVVLLGGHGGGYGGGKIVSGPSYLVNTVHNVHKISGGGHYLGHYGSGGGYGGGHGGAIIVVGGHGGGYGGGHGHGWW